MDFKILIKRILILVLLLVILGGIVLGLKYQIGQDYFDKVKSVLSKLNVFKAALGPELPFPEEIEIPEEEITFETEEEEREEGLIGEIQEPEIAPEPEVALAGIQEKVNEIAEKTEEISQEVDKLLALTEIQKEINVIAEKTGQIAREVNELRTLAEIQEKIDKITEGTNILSQEVSELV